MLKEKLKAALKAAGLNEELADKINITSESQIEGIVISLQSTQNSQELNFTEILGSQEFANFINTTGFDNVVKLSKPLQSEHDKKVTAGIKTFQEKWLKKANGDDTNDDDNDPSKKNDDMPAWAKTLMEKVDNFEKSKTKTSKLEQAKAIIDKSTVLNDAFKNKWLSRFDLEAETSFEDQLKNLETEFTELHTSIVGSSAGKGLPIGGQGNNGEASDELVNQIADSLI